MNLNEFELKFRKLLVEAIDAGLEPNKLEKLIIRVAIDDDWTYSEPFQSMIDI